MLADSPPPQLNNLELMSSELQPCLEFALLDSLLNWHPWIAVDRAAAVLGVRPPLPCTLDSGTLQRQRLGATMQIDALGSTHDVVFRTYGLGCMGRLSITRDIAHKHALLHIHMHIL